MTDGFFNVDILSGLHRPDAHQRMPMVRCCGGNDLDVIRLQGVAKVTVDFGPRALRFLDLAGRPFSDFGVDVNDRSDLGSRIMFKTVDMGVAPTVESGDRNPQFFAGTVRRCGRMIGVDGGRQTGERGGRCEVKLAAAELTHLKTLRADVGEGRMQPQV